MWKAVASFEYASFVKVEDIVWCEEGYDVVVAACQDNLFVVPSDVLLQGVGHGLGGVPINDGGKLVDEGDVVLRDDLSELCSVLFSVGEVMERSAPIWYGCESDGAKEF